MTSLVAFDCTIPATPYEEAADLDLVSALLERELPGSGRDAAAALITDFGGLAGVAAADAAALARTGLPPGAVAGFASVRALALAMGRAEACRRPALSSWSALREQFRALYLNKRNILIREELRADGTVDHAPVYPREVVRRALELSATALILVHNHPSGDPTPSRADIDMTKRIIDAARVFDITVHDHVIVGPEGTKSLRTLGLM